MCPEGYWKLFVKPQLNAMMSISIFGLMWLCDCTVSVALEP